jgi:hypothetical protein
MRRTSSFRRIVGGLLYSCATFPTDYGNIKRSRTARPYDNKKISLLGLTIRPEEQIDGLPLKPKVIERKFLSTDWKPGRYNVETITFWARGSISSDKAITQINSIGTNVFFFEVKKQYPQHVFVSLRDCP